MLEKKLKRTSYHRMTVAHQMYTIMRLLEKSRDILCHDIVKFALTHV